MRKVLNYIFIVLFLTVCIIPLIFSNKKAGMISTVENRALAEFPKVFKDDGAINPELKTEFNSWLNDNIGFRDTLMGFNTKIQYTFFNKINSSDVILGKNGWLFYQGEGGISINDYQAKELYTEKQLKKILKNVAELQKWCHDNDMEFVLMLMPNKEHVYSELMPDGIQEVNKKKNIDLVVDYIRENSDIKVVYPKEELLKAKKNYDVYYKYDTHWNDLGAYEGYKALMSALNITPVSFENIEIREYDGGDLANMAMLSGIMETYDENFISYSGTVETLYDDENGNNAYQKYRYNDGHGKIFFMGDSFRDALKPMLSRTFEYSDFVHRDTEIFDEVLKEKLDIFVYQMVERYVSRLENPVLK